MSEAQGKWPPHVWLVPRKLFERPKLPGYRRVDATNERVFPEDVEYVSLSEAQAMVREALDQVAEKIRRIGGYWGADTAADFIKCFEARAQKEQA